MTASPLSIKEERDRVLIKCHAGCTVDEVLAPLGLTTADLFLGDSTRKEAARPVRVATYEYTDSDGVVLFRKMRFEPKNFRISPPGAVSTLSRKPLYRLPEVIKAARQGGTIYVVEGEKDADALIHLGHVATCNYDGAGGSGSASKWRPEYTEALRGAEVIVIADRDVPGRLHASRVWTELRDAGIVCSYAEPALGKDVSDHLTMGRTVSELAFSSPTQQEQSSSLASGAGPSKRAAANLLDWNAVWSASEAGEEWLCEPLLEKGRATALYSPPKAGKSLLSLEIAAALASGRPVLGNAPAAPRRVLYVDLENARGDVHERLMDMGYGPDELELLSYASFPAIGSLDSADGAADLIAVVDEVQAELVVLDTVSRIIGGPEDSADTFAALYRHTMVPLKARGVTVLRLDHSGKDVGRGQRGSSAKSADVDHVWQLSATKTSLNLKRDATRTGHGRGELHLVRKLEPLRHEVVEAKLKEDVVAVVIDLLRFEGVGAEVGRDRVRELLKTQNISISNAALAEALRRHKVGCSSAISDLSRTA